MASNDTRISLCGMARLLLQTIREEDIATTISPIITPPHIYNPYQPPTSDTNICHPTSPRRFDSQLYTLSRAQLAHQYSVDPTSFLSGITKILRSEPGQFWLDHLERIHRPSPGQSTKLSPETLVNLTTHAALLQRLRPNVLPRHRILLPF